jgi:hypothetical protein
MSCVVCKVGILSDYITPSVTFITVNNKKWSKPLLLQLQYHGMYLQVTSLKETLIEGLFNIA